MPAGISREDFTGVLSRAAAGLEKSPVSGAILRYCLEELKKGEPAWWKGVEKAWAKRVFNYWNEPWQLFLAAVHFEALNDEKNPLIPYFPSCGGTAEADPAKPLEKFLAKPPESFFENLETRHPRHYFFAFVHLWVVPAMRFFARRGLPYYFVQLNAGAGLDLIADLTTSLDVEDDDRDLVAARIGLDPAPLLVEDIVQRRWMTAGIFPENLAAIEALDKAIDALLEGKRRDPNFVQLVPCLPKSYLGFIEANIPAGDPDAGLLLFTASYSNKLDDAAYAKFKGEVAALLAPWEDRGLWLELEPVRGEIYSTTAQLIAHRISKGAMAEKVLYRFDGISMEPTISWEGADAFLDLAPVPPKKKP